MKKNNTNTKIQKQSLVPPWLAAVLSAIIPGLGQAFARVLNRALLIFGSFATIIGLFAWRIAVEGRRYDELITKIQKAFKFEPVLIVVAVFIVILYAWIIIDAYKIAKKTKAGETSFGTGLLFFVLVLFFMLGWQIGGIDLGAFFGSADEAIPTISRVLWPWEKAIY